MTAVMRGSLKDSAMFIQSSDSRCFTFKSVRCLALSICAAVASAAMQDWTSQFTAQHSERGPAPIIK
jgi:hypothetical protein